MGSKFIIVRATARAGIKRPMTGRMDVRDWRQGSPDAATPGSSRDPVRDTGSQAGGAALAPFMHGMIPSPPTHEIYPDHDLVPAVGILVSALLCGLFWFILHSLL
jgi:hypothetical protein